jgi:2-amino-4-hydroxy-6-hydroxymethyldihydropteridine diphosphokinase
MTASVYIALGSNIGDRQQNLSEAIRLLIEAGAHILQCSRFYETEPVDYLDQEWFLNAVLHAETDLSPIDLLHMLRSIETQMGSKKAFAKGPRRIDLDVLLYNDAVIDTPELQVPHPRMLARKFVLVPLAEIAPELRHPTWPATAAEMLHRTPDQSEVRAYSPPE